MEITNDLPGGPGRPHAECTICGTPTPKMYTACENCRGKLLVDRYNALPFIEWDYKTPLMLWNDDVYFVSADDIDEYLDENELKIESLRLVVCEPSKLCEIDLDYWSDYWPEDGEPPKEFLEKLDDLNEHIKRMKPVSWGEGKKRTTYNPHSL